jgi:hypothetical protein
MIFEVISIFSIYLPNIGCHLGKTPQIWVREKWRKLSTTNWGKHDMHPNIIQMQIPWGTIVKSQGARLASK